MGNLVLARMPHEELMIGEAGTVLTGPIVVSVVDVRGDKVRLSVNAERSVAVHRREVWERIQAEGSKRVQGSELRVEGSEKHEATESPAAPQEASVEPRRAG